MLLKSIIQLKAIGLESVLIFEISVFRMLGILLSFVFSRAGIRGQGPLTRRSENNFAINGNCFGTLSVTTNKSRKIKDGRCALIRAFLLVSLKLVWQRKQQELLNFSISLIQSYPTSLSRSSQLISRPYVRDSQIFYLMSFLTTTPMLPF